MPWPFYGAERHDEELVTTGPKGAHHDLFMAWITGGGWGWWYGSKFDGGIFYQRDGGFVRARREDTELARSRVRKAAIREQKSEIKELESKLKWHRKILAALESE